MPNRLKRIGSRIATLEKKLLPAPGLDLHWIPEEKPGPDEELVLYHEEKCALGWFRIFDIRKKNNANTDQDHAKTGPSAPR